MFENLYRVLVKTEDSKIFRGTGQTDDGAITIETNVLHQCFYPESDALKLQEILTKEGFEVKLKKGN